MMPKMPNSGDVTMPKVPDSVRIPNASDPDLIEARRKKMLKEFGERQGRESTDLSMGADTSYSRTTLG